MPRLKVLFTMELGNGEQRKFVEDTPVQVIKHYPRRGDVKIRGSCFVKVYRSPADHDRRAKIAKRTAIVPAEWLTED